MANEPTLDQVAPGGVVNLKDAPAGLDDATFDSLFPAEPKPSVTAPVVQETKPASAVTDQTTAPQTTASAPFLKGNKSVYNSPEAALEGINQKDALIENLRQRYALTTGVDPITNQPVQAAQTNQPVGTDYYSQPDKYLDDLYAAAKSGGPQAYRDVQAKFLLDTLKPLQPVLARAAREQAVEVVAQEIKEVGNFIGSSEYDQALASVPELKEAIHTAESDYRFHSKLPGLYKIAYLAGQGARLPEIIKTQAAESAKNQNPTTQVRPTAVPTTQAIPSQTTQAPRSFRTIDGIRAVIQDAEAKGMKLDF